MGTAAMERMASAAAAAGVSAARAAAAAARKDGGLQGNLFFDDPGKRVSVASKQVVRGVP
jgi:hypothetical protein